MNGRLYILCYHRVLPRAEADGVGRPYFVRGTAMREETFRAQCRALRAHFTLLGEDDVLSWLASDLSLDRDACWVTFDDGYIDLVERVAPILAGFGVPATAFVPTTVLAHGHLLPADRWYAALTRARRRRGTLAGFASESWTFDLDNPADYARFIDGPEKRRFLQATGPVQDELLACLMRAADADAVETRPALYAGAADLKHLAETGWSIGSHSVSHALLPGCDDGTIDDELAHSRARLAALGLPRPRAFAYPDGAWTGAVAARVKACGYEAAVTLGVGASLPSARFSLPRLLPQDDPAWVERVLLAGS